MQKLFLCALLLVVSNTVAARSIDLNYHSDALRATYAFGMQRNVEGDVGILILDKQGTGSGERGQACVVAVLLRTQPST